MSQTRITGVATQVAVARTGVAKAMATGVVAQVAVSGPSVAKAMATGIVVQVLIATSSVTSPSEGFAMLPGRIGLYLWAYQTPVVPPVVPPGSQPLFGTRPIHEGQLVVTGDGNIIENLFFKDMPYQFDGTNGHVGILLNGATNTTIRNCDFQNMSEPIVVWGGGQVLIEDNRCDGITGPSVRHNVQTGNFVQTVEAPTFVTIRRNKIKGGDTEDIISLWSASDSLVEDNQIDGTGWSSLSGTGIILGDGTGHRNVARDNTLYNPGQVGVCIAGGWDHTVENNVIYQEAGHPGANIAAYCYDYSNTTPPMSGHAFIGNRAYYQKEDGSLNGFWNPGGADNVGNNWEDATIDPADLRVVL